MYDFAYQSKCYYKIKNLTKYSHFLNGYSTRNLIFNKMLLKFALLRSKTVGDIRHCTLPRKFYYICPYWGTQWSKEINSND